MSLLETSQSSINNIYMLDKYKSFSSSLWSVVQPHHYLAAVNTHEEHFHQIACLNTVYGICIQSHVVVTTLHSTTCLRGTVCSTPLVE